MYDRSIYENTPYNIAGLYLEAQFIKKFAYDLGYGAAFFADMNPKYSIIGARLDFYFSGAYRGYAKGYHGPKKGVE